MAVHEGNVRASSSVWQTKLIHDSVVRAYASAQMNLEQCAQLMVVSDGRHVGQENTRAAQQWAGGSVVVMHYAKIFA